jgi:hypothetical protein
MDTQERARFLLAPQPPTHKVRECRGCGARIGPAYTTRAAVCADCLDAVLPFPDSDHAPGCERCGRALPEPARFCGPRCAALDYGAKLDIMARKHDAS